MPSDAAVLAEAANIAARFPGLVDVQRNKGSADPFVIALARLRAATVVPGEKFGTATRPNTPDVCKALSIPRLTFLEIVRAEGWRS